MLYSCLQSHQQAATRPPRRTGSSILSWWSLVLTRHHYRTLNAPTNNGTSTHALWKWLFCFENEYLKSACQRYMTSNTHNYWLHKFKDPLVHTTSSEAGWPLKSPGKNRLPWPTNKFRSGLSHFQLEIRYNICSPEEYKNAKGGNPLKVKGCQWICVAVDVFAVARTAKNSKVAKLRSNALIDEAMAR